MKFEDFLREHFVLNCWESPRSQGNRGSREQMSVSGHRAPGGGKEKAAPGSDKEREREMAELGSKHTRWPLKKNPFPLMEGGRGWEMGDLLKYACYVPGTVPGTRGTVEKQHIVPVSWPHEAQKINMLRQELVKVMRVLYVESPGQKSS